MSIRKEVRYLPQISRFFPVNILVLGGKLFFWTVLFGFLIYNFIPLPFLPTWKKIILSKGEVTDVHILLGEEFWANNLLPEAEREYQIARSKIKDQRSKIFMEVRGKLREIKKKKEEAQELERETTRWEKILEKRPNYRDAYLKLAMLHYQLRRTATARDYLARAKELDPNFPLMKELEKILQK